MNTPGSPVDRVAVVTGAAGGIGRALVETFVADGFAVAMADVQEELLEAEAADLRDAGADVLAMRVDVADPASVDAFAAEVRRRFHRVDVLCNNAGTIAFGSAWELDLTEWHRVLDVNLLSVVHGIRAFVPLLRSSGDDGRILNVASMAAFMQLGGASPYVATKHAVVGLSIALAEDLANVGSGISVSVACPGVVSTNFLTGGADLPADADLPTGMISAAEAAVAIRAGMDARRFYIFTHEESASTVRDRFERSLAGFATT